MKRGEWTRPKACGSNGTCPEVKFTTKFVMLRNSADPGTVIAFSYEEWLNLQDGISQGEFDVLDTP